MLFLSYTLFYLTKSYFTLSPFFVSLFFPFQLFVLIALVSISFSLMGTVPIYTKSSSLDFTLLPLLLANYFCLLQTPLRSAHYPFGL